MCLASNQEVAGSIFGIFTILKSGLGLEWDPLSLVRTIGWLVDREVADLIKKVNIN